MPWQILTEDDDCCAICGESCATHGRHSVKLPVRLRLRDAFVCDTCAWNYAVVCDCCDAGHRVDELASIWSSSDE